MAMLVITQRANTVNAEEFTYFGCSVEQATGGDFYSLDDGCGGEIDLATHLARCSNNSGSINISEDECRSLAYLFFETHGDTRYATGGWFSDTDVANWMGGNGSAYNSAITPSGGHVI